MNYPGNRRQLLGCALWCVNVVDSGGRKECACPEPGCENSKSCSREEDARSGRPPSGYGRRFLTSDGRADLTVQSIPNVAGDSPAVFLAKKNPPPNIVYKRVTPRFFAVSSFDKGKIWYNRCNFSGRFVNCVLINYPVGEKRQWDSVVTRISNTLASNGG